MVIIVILNWGYVVLFSLFYNGTVLVRDDVKILLFPLLTTKPHFDVKGNLAQSKAWWWKHNIFFVFIEQTVSQR